jgi:hypothetical protein
MATTMTQAGLPQVISTRYSSTERHDISRCERGASPCAGKLFGAKRGDGEAFFEQLPADDPHSFQLLPAQAAQPTQRQGR